MAFPLGDHSASSRQPSFVGNIAFVPTGAYIYSTCCLGSADGQLLAVDTTNPAAPQLLGTLFSPDDGLFGPPQGNISGATLYDSHTIYVSGSTAVDGFNNYNNGTGKLVVADITNPAAMSVVTQLSRLPENPC